MTSQNLRYFIEIAADLNISATAKPANKNQALFSRFCYFSYDSIFAYNNKAGRIIQPR